MQEETIRVIVAFLVSLVIVFLTAKLIGEENKKKWFKKRTKDSIFTRRGFLGESCHFGRPCTWQGMLIAVVLLGGVITLGYLIVFTKLFF